MRTPISGTRNKTPLVFLTNSRHGLADNGGAWVSYFGGNFSGDNGTINYDQDVNGIMVGVDTKIDGNNAKWIVDAAARLR
ncbi:hypothetical protein DMH88_18180 [Escherichia coli]|nr:hypothetical protein [Escherichia coli]